MLALDDERPGLQLHAAQPELAAAASIPLLLLTIILLRAEHMVLGRRGYSVVGGKNSEPRIVRLGNWRWVMLAGAMLAFTLSLDDFIITFFTNGPGSTTLPIYVYGLLRRTITPEVNALSTMWILVVFLALLASNRVQRRTI